MRHFSNQIVTWTSVHDAVDRSQENAPALIVKHDNHAGLIQLIGKYKYIGKWKLNWQILSYIGQIQAKFWNVRWIAKCQLNS